MRCKKFLPIVLNLMVSACLLMAAMVPAMGQTAPAANYNKVLGEVIAIDPAGKKITVKADNAPPADVPLDENTSYMRVPPGEKDLRKAVRIELKDLSLGDRVYARSRKVEGQELVPATSVLVMSKAELAQHQEKSREEWQKRGAAGKVKSVDPAGKSIVIAMQTPVGLRDLTVQTDEKTSFRRYAPDSVRFADAKPSNFGEVAVGNNVRVLGNRTEDGAKLQAEEVVSGSFRNLAGAIESVNPQGNELKLKDLESKKSITVRINEDTNLRKLPPQMAMMMMRMRGGASPAGLGAGRPGNGSTSEAGGSADHTPEAAANGHQEGAVSPGAEGPGGPGRRMGGPGMGRMDMNQLMERVPKITLAELKPGDAVLVSSTAGTDASSVTAIAVVAGVDPLLRDSSSASNILGGAWNFDMGMQ